MKLDNSGYPALSFGLSGYTIWGDVPYTFGDAMALQPDGKILIVGSTGQLLPDNNDWALWRFNADGNIDNTFGTDGVTTTEFFGNADEALGIALYQDKIIVAGKTRNATNYLDFAVAEYNNDNYFNVSATEHVKAMNCSVSPNPVMQNGKVSIQYELNQTEDIYIELVTNTGTSALVLQVGKQNADKEPVHVLRWVQGDRRYNI